MRTANERRQCNVMSSLIGWAHSQNDPGLKEMLCAKLRPWWVKHLYWILKITYIPWNMYTVSVCFVLLCLVLFLVDSLHLYIYIHIFLWLQLYDLCGASEVVLWIYQTTTKANSLNNSWDVLYIRLLIYSYNRSQGPPLLTWINFSLNMDK